MTERRSWTEEENNALKYLKDTLQIKKWSEISRRLQFQFNLPGRNGKQCRQRYTNHLDSSIVPREFTPEDEEKLFRLHDQIGNRWSLISKQFIGRTDNHIKNNFHSKLRKAIRKLNKQIKQHFKKSIKPFKLSLIYKVVEASDYRFSSKVDQKNSNSINFNQLKNSLLQYVGGRVQKTDLSNMKLKDQTLLLVAQLNEFEKCFKDAKLSAKSEKIKLSSSQKVAKKIGSKQDTTENSEQSEEMDKSISIEEAQDQDSIFEDVSFQFVHPKQLISNEKLMDDETKSLPTNEKLEDKLASLQLLAISLPYFYSFQKSKTQNQDQKNKFENIPLNLIQEEELAEVSLERKLSIRSFQSLREYDDALNDSEMLLMMRRFDSYSDIEAGLFQ